jgi:hypothetical protein
MPAQVRALTRCRFAATPLQVRPLTRPAGSPAARPAGARPFGLARIQWSANGGLPAARPACGQPRRANLQHLSARTCDRSDPDARVPLVPAARRRHADERGGGGATRTREIAFSPRPMRFCQLRLKDVIARWPLTSASAPCPARPHHEWRIRPPAARGTSAIDSRPDIWLPICRFTPPDPKHDKLSRGCQLRLRAARSTSGGQPVS